MRTLKSYKGFTLIELLVVIAIIGVLSAVVLAAVSTARSKGNDAALKSNVDTISTDAGLYITGDHTSYGTYDDGSGNPTACPSVGAFGNGVFYDPNVEAAVASGLADSGGGTALCLSTDATYAIAITRPTQPTAPTSVFWCADSTGLRCGNDGNAADGVTPIVGGVCVPCSTQH